MNAHTPVADATTQQARPKNPARRSLLSMGIGRFAGPAPVQEWAVAAPSEEGGLLPAEAPALFVGPGGVGKTHSSLELALKIADNGDGKDHIWMGQKVLAKGVSVFLTWEEATDTLHRDIQDMSAAAGIDPEVVANRMLVKSYQDVDVSPAPLVINNPATRSPDRSPEYNETTKELRQIQAEIGALGCIVIDNVGTAFATEGNDYQSANQALKWIQRWAAEFKCLVIVIAHTNKEALRFETDNPSINELKASVMGSTGWLSAVRLGLMFWGISEESEAKIAKTLEDEGFKPGVSVNRYIKARVIKSNVRGSYAGAFTLKRADSTLTDITRAQRQGASNESDARMFAFAAAIGRAWSAGLPLQKSGKHGVYENRGNLGTEYAGASKGSLHAMVDKALAAKVLRTEGLAPNGEAGRWLFDTTGQGVREACDHAHRIAGQAKKHNHKLPTPRWDNVKEWRHHAPHHIAALSDDEVTEALRPPGTVR